MNKEATKERIVSAALTLFQSKGFDATTTKEISRRAKIAEGTVFNYFPTKEDIALHFFELELDHAIATVRGNARLRKAPLDEKLFALVQSQLDYIAPYERFIGAAVVHALRPSSALGPFGIRSQLLHLRYVAFVQELIDASMPKRRASAFAVWAPGAFWVLYIGVLLYWLRDTSAGKEHTLAFLDRILKVGVRLLSVGEGR
jgi:AcrR family transcriptional regulator